jgi:hypothetical protein
MYTCIYAIYHVLSNYSEPIELKLSDKFRGIRTYKRTVTGTEFCEKIQDGGSRHVLKIEISILSALMT